MGERLTKIDIAALRREYQGADLDEASVLPDPVDQFRHWLEQAVDIHGQDASAMALATADTAGAPSVRVVLLKGFGEDGFVFFTNYGSKKAGDLEENPQVAAVFWWSGLDRQVRIQGRVVRTSVDESRRYFAMRPRGSQLSAVASPQSRVVPSRKFLEEAIERAEEAYGTDDISCPETWGGYRILPDSFEFWQGRPNRLHDRIRYRRDAGSTWKIERLAP